MRDAVDILLDDVKCLLERFEPKPGDVFVLTFPGELSAEHAKRMREYWNEQLPYKILVIAGGAKIELESLQ